MPQAKFKVGDIVCHRLTNEKVLVTLIQAALSNTGNHIYQVRRSNFAIDYCIEEELEKLIEVQIDSDPLLTMSQEDITNQIKKVSDIWCRFNELGI